MATGAVNSTVASYLGELFRTNRRPNTLLKLLGGIQGGIHRANGKEFPIGVYYDLRSPAQPSNLEGAAAPTSQHRTLTQSTNVVQIFHEAIGNTYLAQSDNTMSGVVAIPFGDAQGTPVNPRDPAFQTMAAIETVAQDLNLSCVRGVYANPANPTSSALKTRGLVTSITTNVVDESGTTVSTTAPAKQVRKMVEKLLLKVIKANGYNPDGTWTLLADADSYGTIIGAYEELASNKTPESRDIVGMKIRTIVTRYGSLMIVMEPDMSANTVTIANLAVCGLVGLEVPGKGFIFEEALAKDGSSDKSQIYAQFGLDHGPEWCHGTLLMPSGYDL